MNNQSPWGYPYGAFAANGYAPLPGGQGLPAPGTNPAAAAGGNRFLRGLLIGGAVAYVLSNEQVQQAAIRGAVRAWSGMQGSVEEMKERFRDAEAELHASQPHE